MNFPHMLYGGDYNPDQWPEETWHEDVRLMQEAGVNLVSLGIFSWTKLEPQPGVFEFGWLDQMMDLLHKHGISVDLATPTAAPPAWMTRQHPEMLPVTADGIQLSIGSRRHYCPHNRDYHLYAKRIAMELAQRYKDHPALVMWHVDNEYACHFGECFCAQSASAFRAWLKQRYLNLEQLNFAWGTAFWSQTYSAWDEIHPPRRAPAFINPTQQLDWARFNSDSWLACFTEQRDIIRQITPQTPITTNFMGFYKPIDYFKFASNEDIVSNDSYPDISQPEWMMDAAMTCDLIRSVGERRPWLLMEQAASQVNWRQRNASKAPGIMRLGSYQAVARGADGILFFQWRASKAGAEKFHSGMLPHAGTDSRTWREVLALGAELKQLNALLGSQVQAEVAILMDWENWWALEQDGKPSADLKLIPQLASYYRALFERNMTVDFVHPEAELSRYKLVIAPNLYIVKERAVENINRYVAHGGTLLMSFFSGIVDENEQVLLGGYPAPFCDMLGLRVEEFSAYALGQTNHARTVENMQLTCSLWSDVIHLHTAQALASYESDYYAGMPVITRNTFGKGTSFYLGTELDATGMGWLIEQVSAKARVRSIAHDIPSGVEASRRVNGKKSWLFLLNHTAASVKIPLEAAGRNLLTGEKVSSALTLEARCVAIIEMA